jgi:hypothetical protein
LVFVADEIPELVEVVG